MLRPLFAVLLCGSLALGHVPAWLHVSTCESEAAGSAATQVKSSADGVAPIDPVVCHSHCCHHAGDSQSASSRGQRDAESSSGQIAGESSGHDHSGHDHSGHDHSGHHHDSHHCVICQSLATPGGLLWQLEVASVHVLVRINPICVADQPAVAASLAIPQPRGPPTLS